MALRIVGLVKVRGMCPAHTSLGALVEVEAACTEAPLEKAGDASANLTKASLLSTRDANIGK